MELTTYFPEDGCKIHLLVYGLDESQFEETQRLRSDIHQLRHYLQEKRLAHSVAHATYPVNGRLSLDHLEKLLVMFDTFEGINGGRNEANNATWRMVLDSLDEHMLWGLSEKYRLTPFSRTPWKKHLTAGSDDHAGLFVGLTHTIAQANSPVEFLDAVRRGDVIPFGRSNTYKSLVFTVYKIAYDYSRQKRESTSKSLLNALTELVFEQREFRLKEKLFLRKLSSSGGSRARIYQHLNSLIQEVGRNSGSPIENKLELVYNRIADLSDEFMRSLVSSIKTDVAEGDLAGFATSFSASIPGIFLSMPFFSAVREMFSNRPLLEDLLSRFVPGHGSGPMRRVLWFTDTFTDLNGVSVTLNKVAGLASASNPGVRIVTALDSGKSPARHDNIVALPFIESFSLPGYESYTLRVPSVLKALDQIALYEPDEIFISTPGPVGLVGLLVAKLMGIRATGFFHTDYSLQASKIIEDETVTDIVESYTRWFFSCCDEVRVPTDEYVSILRARGYEPSKLRRFHRGIDTSEFAPRDESRLLLAERLGIDFRRVLVYTGRVSRDKNLDVALEAYRRILQEFPGTGFVIAGDGPGMEEMREKARCLPGLKLIGRIPNWELPDLYSLADLFVFPSETDTFGMSVLEAQACGLPAVVSSIGGPREIIRDGMTGFIARAGDIGDWTKKISRVLDMAESRESEYQRMRENARLRVLSLYDWNHIFGVLFQPARQTWRSKTDYRTSQEVMTPGQHQTVSG